MSPEKYMSMLAKTKSLAVSHEFGKYEFNCRYRPSEELILLEHGTQKLTRKVLDSLNSKYSDMVYFNFTIHQEGRQELTSANGESNYYQMLDYLSNQIQNDFYLIDGKDTIPCGLCHYERNFDLSSANVINVGFQSEKLRTGANHSLSNDLHLVYDDKLLSVGILHFHFDKNAINQLPELDYEKN